MPEVKVTHNKLTDPDAANKPPRRPPIVEGDYIAVIMAAPLGVTKGTPPLNKVSVEFQILHTADERKDTSESGRRVFQDYVLEPDAAKPDLSAQRRWELRMLLDSAKVPYTDDGFNTDHLVTKTVKITVIHKKGDKVDDDGKPLMFTNIKKVDTAEEISDEDLV
jgi:hypothetical protein